MKFIIAPVLMLTLIACNSGKEDGKSSNPKKEIIPVEAPSADPDIIETKSLRISSKRKVVLENDFSNIEEFKTNINSYVATFEAKSGNFSNAKITCRKAIFNRIDSEISGEFDTYGEFATLDIEILNSDPAEIEFDCHVEENEQVLEKVTIELKKSFIVTGKKSFQSFVNTNKMKALFLDIDSELSTNGENLDLEIEEFISNKGKVVTFFEEDVAKTRMNRPGLSGGVLNLNIGTAVGAVVFEMRGLNGGEQTLVPERNKNVPSANANLNGICGNQYYHSSAKQCWGKMGAKGFIGLQGYQGYSGGDSGILNFKTAKRQFLDLEIRYFPGKGSMGGKGGQGGVGGPGGRGSHIKWLEHESDNSKNKYKFPDGAQGPEGQEGALGLAGFDGKNNETNIEFQFENMHFTFDYDWKNF